MAARTCAVTIDNIYDSAQFRYFGDKTLLFHDTQAPCYGAQTTFLGAKMDGTGAFHRQDSVCLPGGDALFAISPAPGLPQSL